MTLSVYNHDRYMQEALNQAHIAYEKGEVPVGAIVVANNRIIARAHNQVELLNDPTAHAEMLAITAAADALGNKYLEECTMYVTLEPCVMCAGALNWAQIRQIYYGASDIKKGYSLIGKSILHPKTKVIAGILEDQCKEIVQLFFRNLRDNP